MFFSKNARYSLDGERKGNEKEKEKERKSNFRAVRSLKLLNNVILMEIITSLYILAYPTPLPGGGE